MVGEGQTVGASTTYYVVNDGARARGAVVDLVCTLWVRISAGGELGRVVMVGRGIRDFFNKMCLLS